MSPRELVPRVGHVGPRPGRRARATDVPVPQPRVLHPVLSGCVAGPPAGSRHRRSTPRATVISALVVTAVAGLGLVGCDRASDGAHADVSRTVRQLDAVLRQALVAGNADTVDRILARDFTIVPPPGEEESRAEYVESVASGALDYQVFRAITPVRVQVSGTLAVATYESHLAVSSGSFSAEHDAWHTHVYEERRGRWRLVWAQATAVGGFPPPQG